MGDSAQLPDTTFGFTRAGASLGAFVTLAYAIWQMWTAIGLSTGAPISWRAQLLLLEGGVPLLFTLGFGCAAWGTSRLRRVGWWLVLAVVLFVIVWTWLVPVHPQIANHAAFRQIILVSVLDPATRRRLVEAAGREHSANLFAFGARYCASRGVDTTVAQDAVQDIFAALLTEHGNGDTSDSVLQGDPSKLKAYLFKAVQLRILTITRGEGRRSVNEGSVAMATSDSVASSPDELYDAVELRECINATLTKCPQRAVHAYRLVHEWGLTYQEAGEVMGVAAQTVGSHLSTVAKRLQSAVRAWQVSASEDIV